MDERQPASASADQRDITICLLCGESNACGLAAGQSSCWCFAETIAKETLDRIPPEARDRACICKACVATPPHIKK